MFLNKIWRRISHTRSLDEASGDMEIAFFESSYRLSYLLGLSSTDKNLSYLMYSGAVKVTILFFIICEIWYLFSESSSLDTVIDNVNVTIIHIIAVLRYQNMIGNKEIFKKLSSSTTSSNLDISTKSRAELIQYWLHINNTYFRLLFTLGSCTLGVWYIYPLVDDLEYNLPVAIHLPVEHRTPGRYPSAYVSVLIVFHYASNIVMYNDLIMQAHLIHLLSQFSILADCFENIIDDCYGGPRQAMYFYSLVSVETYVFGQQLSYVGTYEFDFFTASRVRRFEFMHILHNSTGEIENYLVNEEFRTKYLKRLGKLVDRHKLILDRTMELRNVLSFPLLGQFGASCILICFAGYQVSATITVNITKFCMSFLYLSCNMFELYIFCHWCDEIKLQSQKICQAVYCSGWECGLSLLPGVKRRLLLVMMRASKPVVLTAGGIYDLSLTSFTSLVKTSYSALTVLLQLR